jgi:hypothetical protein
MTERLYRTQVLLEQKQHQELSELAQRKGQSISNVVREAVARYLEDEADQTRRQLDVFEDIRAFRAKILARRGGKPIDIDLETLIDKMREERDSELLQNLLGRD